jgi:Concanavalin A-like lectin/glucanases superfamily
MTRFLKSVVLSIAAALICSAFTQSVIATPPLLSYYAFNNTAQDELGNSPDIYLNRTSFTNGTLSLSAAPYSYTAYATVPDLSYDSFTLSIDFNPSSLNFPNTTLLSCGMTTRWLNFEVNPAGQLRILFNNGNLLYAFTNAISTNTWHTLVCSIDLPMGIGIVYLDGQHLPDMFLQHFHFDIASTTNAASEKTISLMNYGNATSFFGYVDNLKIYSGALTPAEIEAQFFPSLCIQRYNQDVLIYWPAAVTDYVLQTSPSPSPYAKWTPYSSAPTIIGNQNVIIENTTTGPHFYRLRKN